VTRLDLAHGVTQLSGYDVIAARDATAPAHHISTVLITGLMIGMIGTITAHELTHRTWDPDLDVHWSLVAVFQL
jgi:hypothetical protein